MANKTYKVALYPAQIDNGRPVWSMVLGGSVKYPETRFEAAKLTEVVDAATSFAKAHGQPCKVSITCLSPRKPAGFDKATDRIYANLPE